MDDLFELLCSDSVLMYDYETAESMLRTLEEKAEGEFIIAMVTDDSIIPSFFSSWEKVIE